MTRPTVSGAGLRGVSQEVFGEQAKELGRSFVLDGFATIIRYVAGQDNGGAPNNTYVPDATPVPAHLEPADLGQAGGAHITADQIVEESPYLIYLHPTDGASVTEQDRISMSGKTWIIRGINTWNKPETVQLQVKEKSG